MGNCCMKFSGFTDVIDVGVAYAAPVGPESGTKAGGPRAPPLPPGSDQVTITIQHVGGVDARDNRWCLNNVYLLGGSGQLLSHSASALFHKWIPQHRHLSFSCSAEALQQARFLGFASQDIQLATISVHDGSSDSGGGVSVSSAPFPTAHWSSLTLPWTAACNEDAKKWAYTAVPLQLADKAADGSGVDAAASRHVSWDDLVKLR